MSPKPKSSKDIVKNCKDSLDELKAINICSFEVEEISSFTSFIMIASGTSGRHIQSIADKVIENLKNKKIDPSLIGKKIGRNEPCFCGSRKKYKHCCGSL